MNRGSILFLKGVIVLIGIIIFVGLLAFPPTEGRATNLDLISIYSDPFIVYIYIASVPFFVALFQAIKLLRFIEKNDIFSQTALKAVRNIKYSAIILICFLMVAIGWIRLASGDDDPAGAIAVGMCTAFASMVIATAAGVFQSLLQNAVDLKSENDLTV